MALSSHIAELVRRHTSLEREIETAAVRLSVDDLTLIEMKRKKLQLKDEIERLKAETSLH